MTTRCPALTADAIRHGRPDDEPAALDPDNDLDGSIVERQRHRVDGSSETRRLLQERRDVVEENSGLRKIGNVANLCFEVVHIQSLKQPSRPPRESLFLGAPGGHVSLSNAET
jgi:hypothetical protein